MQAQSRPSSAMKNSINKKQLCLAIAAMLAPGLTFAAPVVGSGGVTSGSATIVQNGSTTNVNQTSDKATINWWSFSTNPSETVNFNQPNSSSMTLNRVIGNERSVLQGTINAPGKVFLINSNGVLFTGSSSVNTGGFVASTLDISDADFNAGNFVFRANGSSGSVINMGTITARDGGYVALLGNSVSNQGVITATRGTVAMSAGNKITLNFNGDSLVNVTIDEGTLNALVENKQAVYADGGRVIMTAKAADDVIGAQVNNSGLVQARTVDDLKGNIELNAHGGTTHIAGTLDASAPTSGDGGFIETSGDKVQIADGSVITTKAANGKSGSWLIDPDGFTVGAGGDISGTTLSDQLNNNGLVTLASTNGSGSGGDLTINDSVSWSANSTLDLTATNNININASINASGTSAGLALHYGSDYKINNGSSVTLSGSGATLNINGNAYTLIHDMAGLAGITGTDRYALGNDLDGTGTTYAGAVVASLNGGTLAGLGHPVSNVTINSTSSNVGLIGSISNGVVRDMKLANVSVTSTSGSVGGLAGFSNLSTISNVSVTGSVSGGQGTGGMFGQILGSTLNNASTNVTVTGKTGTSNIGGLVGISNASGTTVSNINDSSANGAVIGTNISSVGGLVGFNTNASRINRSTANGPVTVTWTSTGGTNIGGLVGWNNSSFIDGSSAHGTVQVTTGTSAVIDVGGLVGQNLVSSSGGVTLNASITNSQATGDVIGIGNVTSAGGLVGANSGNIDHSSASGKVTGVVSLGGLVGTNSGGSATSLAGTISNSSASGAVSWNNFGTAPTSGSSFGGLVGSNGSWGKIDSSSATGNVSGKHTLGGLVGANSSGIITNSTASGNVTGTGINTSTGWANVGGLVGNNQVLPSANTPPAGSISNSSSTGNVSGNGPGVGGAVGSNGGTTSTGNVIFGGDINNTQASGSINGSANPDLTGQNTGNITNSSWHDAPAQARADAAAAKQARTTDANQRTNAFTGTQQSMPSIPQNTSFANSAPSVSGNIVVADSLKFGADVKSITVDGVKFDLGGEGSGKSKNGDDAGRAK